MLPLLRLPNSKAYRAAVSSCFESVKTVQVKQRTKERIFPASASPTASASICVLCVVRVPSLSDSTRTAVSQSVGCRGRWRWRPTFPSFLPSLSNVCESRTDRASGRARGRGSGRKDDKIISASEWIAVPQCDISHPPFPPCYQATRLHGASILQAGVSVAQDGVARRCSTILALAEYQEEKRDLPTLSYHQISFL